MATDEAPTGYVRIRHKDGSETDITGRVDGYLTHDGDVLIVGKAPAVTAMTAPLAGITRLTCIRCGNPALHPEADDGA